MIGTSLSRWTLSYFATALTGLIAAELLMTAGFGFPSDPVEAPETLILVHIIAIGWLTALGLAKLYNVVAFLTWLECYGPLLGKRPTPRVQYLVDEPRAFFWLYFGRCCPAVPARGRDGFCLPSNGLK